MEYRLKSSCGKREKNKKLGSEYESGLYEWKHWTAEKRVLFSTSW